MAHWFDTWLRKAATTDASRRRAMAGGMGMILSSSAASPALAQRRPVGSIGPGSTVMKRPPQDMATKPAELPQPGATSVVCNTNGSGGAYEVDLTVTDGDLSLRFIHAVDLRARTKRVSMDLTNASAIVVQFNAQIGERNELAANFAYGSTIQGVQSTHLNSLDGRTLTGVVDGRNFTATQPRSMRELRFADGGAAPEVVVDPDLRRRIAVLSAKVGDALRGCHLQPGKSMRDRFGARAMEGWGRSAPRIADPMPVGASAGINWYAAGEYFGDSCVHCVDSCGDDYAKCWLDNAVDFLCAPCAVAAVLTCMAYNYSCLEACYASGNGCCPVGCGLQVDSRNGVITYINCCSPGDTCLGQNSGHCCPKSNLVCGDTCCDPGVTSCTQDNTCGCYGNLVGCEGKCCQPGDVCCGGECCPSGLCQNDHCCINHCGDGCCGPFSACCNNVCCPPNAQCIGGHCCPKEQSCGSVCCGSGTVCEDARIGRCGTAVTCGPLQRPCTSMTGQGYTTVCCERSPLALGALTCCNGECCGPGQVCCYNRQAGRSGCWDPGQCDRLH